MGCVMSTKKAAPVTPALDSSGASWEVQGAGEGAVVSLWDRIKVGNESGESARVSSHCGSSRSFRLGNFHKQVEAEQVAAGWPAWLCGVSGEAIKGWVPLKADSFEKLEKIGQGTYSSVFKARNLDSGKIVALKKVRFDNFEPESVRFMAREIQILRRLDHPNVIKLEGLIASHLSCSLYLVFEYMEHDLAGLISSPVVKFSDSQIKCYMRQLLSGLEHCHSRGVMHRDIKCANLLVSDEGIMKVADFGLANFLNPEHKQPLTSRVVTLWYRPPELLLGSTDYGTSVDLWSVGCVFGEMLLRRPILQGRTEVEQLHKIFKLCGSPPEEYWKKSKLPHTTLFRPQHNYENCLGEIFRNLSSSAFSLLKTFLSVEPYKRGTASTALASEYFKTKPYACEPSDLPHYPPTKEIDIKRRESHRKKVGSRRLHDLEATRKPSIPSRPSREASSLCEFAYQYEGPRITSRGIYDKELPRLNVHSRASVDTQPASMANPRHDYWHIKHLSQLDQSHPGPLQVSISSGFAWAKKQREDHPCGFRSHTSNQLESSSISPAKHIFDLKEQDHEDNANSRGQKTSELSRHAMLRHWMESERQDSFNVDDLCRSNKLSRDQYGRDSVSFKHVILDEQDQGNKIEFSSAVLSRSCKIDEFLVRRVHHIQEADCKSWLQRGRKQGE
ncbi:hypothetical protein J5N97_028586 [Dioscorea zingiberensis]|uniref:[RNA-polymerase]-subunit kinase n=1 Tax=Dioscorea zingiberensis TaxID=325984 RepID=A0A9D5BZF9_9LILI|nr:hypothetical protein J5N97_028586 [Dioscorea zingiberensis]